MLRSAQVRAEFAEEIVVPCQVFGLTLGFVQLRAGLPRTPCSVLVPGQNARSASEFAEKTVLCEISLVDARAAQNRATLLRYMLGSGRSAPDLPRKPCSVLGFSAIVARLRFFRENTRLVSELNAWVRAGSAPGLPRKPCSALCSSPIQR